MSRALALLLLSIPALSGCAMCCGTDDYNYAAFGGSWQRGDMSQGRVGSAFGSAGGMSDYSIVGEPIEAAPNPVDLLPDPESSMSDMPQTE